MAFGDFYTALSRLGEGYDQGLRENERKRAVSGLGVNPGDPQFLPKLGQALIGLGDVNGAIAVSRLQSADADRAYQRTRDASNDAFRERAFTTGREDVAFDRNRQAGLDKLTDYYRDKADQRADQQSALAVQQATRREYPAGYEADPANPGGQRPVPGGPQDPATIARVKAAENASKAEKPQPLGGELAARIGLGNQFLDNDLPEIRKQIDAGALGGNLNPYGVVAAAQMATGSGVPGEINRRVSTGIDALMRNLTGAGMSESEAKAYADRYRPQAIDSVEKIRSKLGGLEKDLKATRDAALAGRNLTDPALTGRSSASPRAEDTPQAQASQPGSPRTVPLNQVPEGARFRRDGRIYRRVNGQDVPE